MGIAALGWIVVWFGRGSSIRGSETEYEWRPYAVTAGSASDGGRALGAAAHTRLGRCLKPSSVYGVWGRRPQEECGAWGATPLGEAASLF